MSYLTLSIGLFILKLQYKFIDFDDLQKEWKKENVNDDYKEISKYNLFLFPALGECNVGHRAQGTEYRVQSTGYRVQSTGYREQGTENRVHGSGYRAQGTGYRVQSTEYRAESTGYRVRDKDWNLSGGLNFFQGDSEPVGSLKSPGNHRFYWYRGMSPLLYGPL